MRFAIFPSLTQPWADVLAVAQHAERTGWDRCYVADHFVGGGGGSKPLTPGYLESTAVLSALAVSTSRLRIGALVFGMTYRHPAVLANWAATADILSGGRLVLGIGAGWQQNEHAQYGIELGRPGARLDRFAEAIRVLRGLLTEEHTSFDGRYYRVTDALCDPKPVQARVPLMIGGSGDRMLGIVAREADEWNQWSTPAHMTTRGAVLDRRCAAIGRDPSSIQRSTQALFCFTEHAHEAAAFTERYAPQPAVAGSPAFVADVLSQWQAAGVDEIVVPDWTFGTGQQRFDAMDTMMGLAAPFRLAR
jgi:alkanesulfonate monooxygenase SsuD/methylene tetrahydromethanopterin reductase-like flavin-dependent oxidoreductase (luciferase family)